MRIDRQLKSRTVYRHRLEIGRYLTATECDPHGTTRNDVRLYLMRFKDVPANTYANVLKSLKVFFRDYLERPDVVQSFRFPKKVFRYKPIPTKDDLIRFYSELEDLMVKTMFLIYATTGLRRNEVLRLRCEDIHQDMRMIIPQTANSTTKHTWISFYNAEAEAMLTKYLEQHNEERVFPVTERYFRTKYTKINKRIGTRITAQTLRDWFSSEMGELGVPDRYIDAFCGRVPRSILARHYTDYSPNKLKRIYDKADISIFS